MPAMPAFLRLSRFRLLRLPLLALLLLAVLANPVLAALGDLHEVQGGVGHAHVGDAHHEDVAGAHADEEGDGSLLHALMHASHCCGHLTAILPAAALVLGSLAPVAVPVAATTPAPRARPESLLRPPISA